ncbi:hypothetical protein SDC9_178334 [bioreactor metagenome]|uniref:Uncharacterized protein n=1 Tax=bioreactor metagenome TaxID=1076179 RepID=A0A645H4U3_9ZZZZ
MLFADLMHISRFSMAFLVTTTSLETIAQYLLFKLSIAILKEKFPLIFLVILIIVLLG